jgi:glycosyltransferase involved in cell wall biosynthesis
MSRHGTPDRADVTTSQPNPSATGASVLATTLTPVLNEERHIRETVAALQSQDLDGPIEFVFIDGRSTDRTRAILEELAVEDPRIKILDNPARHTASALNIGLRAAQGEYVARIDAHTWYPPSYLSLGIARLRQGGADWVAGPQIPVGGDGFSGWVATALESPLATGGSNRWDADRAASAEETELGTGVFTGVWRRSVLDRHHGWDEGWPINQDSELAARFQLAGERIVSLPQLGARYTPRDSVRRLGRQYFRYGMYRAKTSLRHPHAVRPLHLAMPALVVAAIAALAGPWPLRLPARALLAGYGTVVAAESARAGSGRARDTAGLSVVFVVMHATWGAGFLVGLVRFARRSTRHAQMAEDLAADRV